MKRIDRRIIIVGAFFFIIGMAYGIMRFLIAQEEDPRMRPPVEAKRYIQAEAVDYQRVQSSVTATGRVASLAQVDLVAEASGKIQVSGVPLKRGSRFSRGEVLFTVYPDEAALALKSKKSRFLQSLAGLLPDLVMDYPQAGERFRSFFNRIDLNSELPPLPEVHREQLRIFLASRNLLSDYYEIKREELKFARYTVRAPFDGAYQQVYLEAGAYTNTGGRVGHIIRTDMLELEIPLKRFDAQWIDIGDGVTVHADKRPRQWQGRVVRKAPFVDADNQSQGIFVEVPNDPQQPLLPGEYLQVTFPGQPVEGVMKVPRNVVFNSNEVFVVNDDRLHKRVIDIVKVNEKSLLFRGLEKGEMLVMQPLINVQEGTLVEILDQSTAAGGMKDPQSEAAPRP